MAFSQINSIVTMVPAQVVSAINEFCVIPMAPTLADIVEGDVMESDFAIIETTSRGGVVIITLASFLLLAPGIFALYPHDNKIEVNVSVRFPSPKDSEALMWENQLLGKGMQWEAEGRLQVNYAPHESEALPYHLTAEEMEELMEFYDYIDRMLRPLLMVGFQGR